MGPSHPTAVDSMNGFNFTEDVRAVLTRSREEANRLRHEYVGTEHILLGLIREPTNRGAEILRQLSVDLGEVRELIENTVKRGGDSVIATPDLPYTSRAKKVLEFAMQAARDLEDSYVGTEHLLLGILLERKGIAAQILYDRGATVEQAYAEVRPGHAPSIEVDSGLKPRRTPAPPSDPGSGVEATGAGRADPPPTSDRREPMVLLVIGIIALIASGIGAYETGTWLLEVFPILLGVPLLIVTRERFPLTPLVYRLIFVHALILMLGGHYTYARVPLGFWVQDALHLARNHYDRLGHFAQGFVPAMIAREILLRTSPVPRGKWLFFLVTCVCLSVSVSYEFIEWAAALIGGSSADAFLGSQGDVWDTQWDMFMAFVGALTAQLLLAGVHDRQLARLRARAPQRS